MTGIEPATSLWKSDMLAVKHYIPEVAHRVSPLYDSGERKNNAGTSTVGRLKVPNYIFIHRPVDVT
jgi:hypothetical protein